MQAPVSWSHSDPPAAPLRTRSTDVPLKAGGANRDPRNFAATCVHCNARKYTSLLCEIGWELRDPLDDGWDGLLDKYRPLWKTLGEPDAEYHTRWVNAFGWAKEGGTFPTIGAWVDPCAELSSGPTTA